MIEEDHGEFAFKNSATLIPAAEYVRMSTEHQRYSTLNQAECIRTYAQLRGFRIVRTYADQGISGLTLRERPALRQLLTDATAGNPGFEALLVYDVSRWGRFQDPDESAAHELTCRRAGIAVHYCAEQFENDGSIASTIIKSVKRAMAGEYSRELSVRCFAGSANLIRRGYRQGGTAGYGLRRMLLDEAGNSKQVLQRGEEKSLKTDRVILVPGPEKEVAVVREIFALFTSGWSDLRIARELNRRRLRTSFDMPWSDQAVRRILANEKYIGNNIWARTSQRLKQKLVRNPCDQWIRRDAAFEPIVDPAVFARAREIRAERARRLSDEWMLDALSDALERRGHLSMAVIDQEEGLMCAKTYQARFGGLLEAYRLVGFSPTRAYRFDVNRRARQLHADIVAELIEGIAKAGGTIEQDPSTDQLRINGEITLSVLVVRQTRDKRISPRWHVTLEKNLGSDLTLIVRLASDDRSVLDFYLLPMDQDWPDRLALCEVNGILIDAYRHRSLDPLFALAARARVGASA